MPADDLLDLLDDLQHDLGKHLRLPLALLPADADAEAVRTAVVDGLLRTRHGPHGTEPAEAVWKAFLDAAPEGWLQHRAAAPLLRAVEQALGWREPALAGRLLDRGEIQRDFDEVLTAIRALRSEVRDGAH